MSTDNNTTPKDEQNPTNSPQNPDVKTGNEDDKDWKAVRQSLREQKEREKALEAELEKFRKAEEEREAKELEKKGEYEKLIQLEKEKYQKQQAKILEEKINAKMEAELVKNGANPDMAELLVNSAVKQAKLDEDGNIVNLTDIVSQAKEKYADVFKPSQRKTPPSTNPQPKKFDSTPSGVSQMSFSEYVELRKSQIE